MDVFTLLVWIIIFIIVGRALYWAITRLVAAFQIPEPVATVILVVAVLLLLLGFLGQVGFIPGIHPWHH